MSEAAPEKDEVALLAWIELLTLHAPRGGWLARSRGTFTPNQPKGRWNCACGAGGDLEIGEGITDAHRRHLAEVLDGYVSWMVQAAARDMGGT